MHLIESHSGLASILLARPATGCREAFYACGLLEAIHGPLTLTFLKYILRIAGADGPLQGDGRRIYHRRALPGQLFPLASHG